jgi:transcription elongation factor Elf1
MYHNFPNSTENGKFSAEDVKRGLIALHTDYECPFCKKWQSVAQMGGYGGKCIQCGQSSNPEIT